MFGFLRCFGLYSDDVRGQNHVMCLFGQTRRVRV